MAEWGVTNYLTYVIGTIMIVLLPGPNSVFVLALAAQRGVQAGWKGAAGIFTGDAILMVATAAGLVTLLNAYPFLFALIKYAGALYLAYIGVRMLISAIRTWPKNKQLEDRLNAPVQPLLTQTSAFRRALIISLLNPKALLFFLSFFVQFVDPTYPSPAIPFLILAVTLQFFSLLYLATLIYGGHYLSETFRRKKRLSALSSGGTGSVFLIFAAKLATASALS